MQRVLSSLKTAIVRCVHALGRCLPLRFPDLSSPGQGNRRPIDSGNSLICLFKFARCSERRVPGYETYQVADVLEFMIRFGNISTSNYDASVKLGAGADVGFTIVPFSRSTISNLRVLRNTLGSDVIIMT